MKKYVLDLQVVAASSPREGYIQLELANPDGPLPEMCPGQFVQVRVDGEPHTFLRRPISINFVDHESQRLWLLVHAVGAGTRALAQLAEGATLNVVLPLGHGFSLPQTADDRVLLVGGGVGTAPLLYLGQEIVRLGGRPSFLLGGRSSSDLLQLDMFERFGDVFLTTEDASIGEKGFVTAHSLWKGAKFDRIYTCGPRPMMMAVARLARAMNIPCEVSLENMMACGLGACLCCVENTTDGHVCVCQEGPVFPAEKLFID